MPPLVTILFRSLVKLHTREEGCVTNLSRWINILEVQLWLRPLGKTRARSGNVEARDAGIGWVGRMLMEKISTRAAGARDSFPAPSLPSSSGPSLPIIKGFCLIQMASQVQPQKGKGAQENDIFHAHRSRGRQYDMPCRVAWERATPEWPGGRRPE